MLRALLLRVLVHSTGNRWWNICTLLDVLRIHCARDGPKTTLEILDCRTIYRWDREWLRTISNLNGFVIEKVCQSHEPKRSRFQSTFRLTASLNSIVRGRTNIIYLTLARQLADSLLNRQITRCIILWNFNATVWTGRDLIAKTTVGQQVGEATSTHKMTQLTLKRLERKENEKLKPKLTAAWRRNR